jgi:hypothetical protein
MVDLQVLEPLDLPQRDRIPGERVPHRCLSPMEFESRMKLA